MRLFILCAFKMWRLRSSFPWIVFWTCHPKHRRLPRGGQLMESMCLKGFILFHYSVPAITMSCPTQLRCHRPHVHPKHSAYKLSSHWFPLLRNMRQGWPISTLFFVFCSSSHPLAVSRSILNCKTVQCTFTVSRNATNHYLGCNLELELWVTSRALPR